MERTAAEGADHYPPPPDYSQYPPPASPGAAGPPYAPGVPGVEPRYSPWWKRVLAALLDGLIISVPSGILGALLGASAFETDPITDELIFDVNGAYIVALVITFIGSLLYYVILEGGPGGATVGKMALGIQVRDERTLSPIGYGRALGRRLVASLLWYLLILPGLLDVLAPLWDGKRRTWHDRIVGSVVIDKR